MAMSVEGENPYTSPTTSDPPPAPPMVSRHDWCGHTVTIESKVLASHLWMCTGCIITVDGKSFASTTLGIQEDLQWSFEHLGEMTTGHFRTHGWNTGFSIHYTLELNGEPLGTFQVPTRGGWKAYAAAVVIGVILIMALNWLSHAL